MTLNNDYKVGCLLDDIYRNIFIYVDGLSYIIIKMFGRKQVLFLKDLAMWKKVHKKFKKYCK